LEGPHGIRWWAASAARHEREDANLTFRFTMLVQLKGALDIIIIS
jgi:hypothetical protein